MAIFKGSAVAIVTPFHDDAEQSINYDAFADILDYQIENGTDAIVVCGSTGESATMTEEEHLEACRFAIEHVAHRVPVVAGSGSNCTRTAMQLTEAVREYGADGALVLTPYYNKGTQEGVYQHFSAIAEAGKGLPIIMYNVPSRSGFNLQPETTARLVKDVPNIVGIKEASGDLSQIVKIMTLTDGNIDLYSGNDDQTVSIMAMGGLGVISVVANVAPRMMHDLCAAMECGDLAKARRLQMDTEELFECLFSEVNPIPVKKAVNLMGFAAGPMRMPLTEMSPAKAEKMAAAMKKLGIALR